MFSVVGVWVGCGPLAAEFRRIQAWIRSDVMSGSCRVGLSLVCMGKVPLRFVNVGNVSGLCFVKPL